MMTSTRLTLRPFARGDTEELLSFFREPGVRRYLLDDELVSEAWVRDEIASSTERFATTGAGLWAIRLRDRRKIIGFVGFREFFDPPRLQLLYGLLPTFWGRGFATEAARRVCDHAFVDLGFGLVEAATDAPNGASARVLHRLGMREVRMDGDETSGTLFYVLDRDSWALARTGSGGAA